MIVTAGAVAVAQPTFPSPCLPLPPPPPPPLPVSWAGPCFSPNGRTGMVVFMCPQCPCVPHRNIRAVPRTFSKLFMAQREFKMTDSPCSADSPGWPAGHCRLHLAPVINRPADLATTLGPARRRPN
eukprot:gene12390-biopygen1916